LLSYSVTDGSGSILAILDAITDIRALYQAVLPGPEPVLEHHERPPDVEGALAGRAAAAADAGADALGRALQRLGRPGVLDPLRLPVAPCPTQLSSGRPRQRVT